VGQNLAAKEIPNSGIGTDVVLMTMGVDYLAHVQVFECGAELGGSVSATGVNQEPIHPVGGRKVERFAQQRPGQVQLDHLWGIGDALYTDHGSLPQR
jgi:hypothetical protein